MGQMVIILTPLSILVNFLVRFAKLSDNVVNVVAQIALLVFNHHLLKLIDQNRHFHLNELGSIHNHLTLHLLSLTKFLRIGNFTLRNQTLKISYLTYNNITLLL